MSNEYIIAGGDMRFSAAADHIAGKGADVRILLPARHTKAKEFLDAEKIGSASDVILPVPVSRDGIYLNTVFTEERIPLERLSSLAKDGGRVFGGKITDKIRKIFSEKNVTVIDYMEDESLTLRNALLTAEGAVMYAMQKQDISLFGQKVLIIGTGRIGKALVKILHGFGADITSAARRRSELAAAEIGGCKTVRTEDISLFAEEFSLVFNTVPARVIEEDFIKRAGRNTLIIDLASAPGGTDFAAAEKYGVKAVNLLGVPGKFSYISAGELIARTVLDYCPKGGNSFK